MIKKYETAIVEFDKEIGVGYVKLNRPESLNALSPQLCQDIIDGLRWLESCNEDIEERAMRVVIIKGANGNFSAGADVDSFESHSPKRTSNRHYRDFIFSFPVTIIAKINGYCLGGGLETAMACDFRIAHIDSQFGLPEVDLGIMPGDGVQFISQLTNPSIAKEIAMTGEHISAERAHNLGILNRVYDDDAFDEATREFAETLASKPPLAIQAIKESANFATGSPLQKGRQFNSHQRAVLRQTQDHKKALRAFNKEEYNPTFDGQ